MKYFTIEELTLTNTGLENVPNRDEIASLRELVENVLDPIREQFGGAIRVTSGFRSSRVNKAIGGALNSQHTKGEAADISCSDNKLLFEIIRDTVVFDQLIWEFGDSNQPAWIHVSYKSQGNRNQVLIAIKINGKTIYKKL